MKNKYKGFQTCTKRFKNSAEAQFQNLAIENGWLIGKRGWPDFFCIDNDGEIRLVEVKTKNEHPLKVDQKTIMEALASYGVPCYKWSPDGGFTKIEVKRKR